jgi:hypothetical protein
MLFEGELWLWLWLFGVSLRLSLLSQSLLMLEWMGLVTLWMLSTGGGGGGVSGGGGLGRRSLLRLGMGALSDISASRSRLIACIPVCMLEC